MKDKTENILKDGKDSIFKNVDKLTQKIQKQFKRMK